MAKTIKGERKRKVRFDLDEKDLKGLEIGEDVTVVLKGKVHSVSMPYEYEDCDGKTKKDDYGDMTVSMTSFEIDQGNEFTEMADEES